MTSKNKKGEKEMIKSSALPSVWQRAFTSKAQWPDKVSLHKFTYLVLGWFPPESSSLVSLTRRSRGGITGLVVTGPDVVGEGVTESLLLQSQLVLQGGKHSTPRYCSQ